MTPLMENHPEYVHKGDNRNNRRGTRMHNFTNHSTAAIASETMPFGGLGFAVDDVQAAARLMVPAPPRCHFDSSGTVPPAPESITQPTGYDLLVSLGREIRGR